MHEFISVHVIPLKELFSDAYHFRLPYFQRAYAWQTTEVGRLLSDITQAMQTERGQQRGYFLGKLMVAKKRGEPETALVDGHQRVMSLTLLFAVLRDLEDDPTLRARLHGFIRGADLRLSPQEVLARTCENLVQAPGATAIEPEDDIAELSETERNVIENRNHLRTELSNGGFTPAKRRELAAFLAERCCVIVSAVEDEDEAWSFLRTEEETRVEFSPSDRAKVSLLSIVPAGEREECQKIWDSCEALLGAADMHAMLGHLRTLKRRKLSGKPVEIDIAEMYKLNAQGNGLQLFAKQFLPAAERLARIRRGEVGTHGRQISALAEQMRWLNTQTWVPAVLLWLSGERGDEETLLFFKRLERMIWLMKIAGYDPTKQHGRIVQLLADIERGTAAARMAELEVSAQLRDAALANLRSPTFDAKLYSGRVLRRISLALGDDPGPVERNTLTIEHILPRGFAAKSGWRHAFPSKRSVQSHAHRLGNLTFLTPADNQAAATLEWSDKRPILARSKFALSNRLGSTPAWTPDEITGRTEELIRLLFKDWELKI